MKSIQIPLHYLLLLLLLGACTDKASKADGYGNFEATEIMISAEANGKLITFDLEEGQLLAPHQVVGVIDTIQLSLQRDQLMASKNTIFSKSKNVLSQRAVLKERLAVARIEQNRIQNLVQAQAATPKQLDDINGQIHIMEQEIKSVETQNAPIINEVRNIEIQIQQVADKIQKSIITNPIQGTVLVKYAEPAEIAVFGKPLYKIADLSYLTLRVYISENQLTHFHIGQEVTIKADAGKDTRSYPGTISWVSETAEFTPKIIQTPEERVNLVYALKVRVKNDGSLKIGMPGEMWSVPPPEEKN